MVWSSGQPWMKTIVGPSTLPSTKVRRAAGPAVAAAAAVAVLLAVTIVVASLQSKALLPPCLRQLLLLTLLLQFLRQLVLLLSREDRRKGGLGGKPSKVPSGSSVVKARYRMYVCLVWICVLPHVRSFDQGSIHQPPRVFYFYFLLNGRIANIFELLNFKE